MMARRSAQRAREFCVARGQCGAACPTLSEGPWDEEEPQGSWRSLLWSVSSPSAVSSNDE